MCVCVGVEHGFDGLRLHRHGLSRECFHTLSLTRARAHTHTHQFDWRVNYTKQEARFRDRHPWTDACGNTLRAVYESLLSVVAGAARAGRCDNATAVAQEVLPLSISLSSWFGVSGWRCHRDTRGTLIFQPLEFACSCDMSDTTVVIMVILETCVWIAHYHGSHIRDALGFVSRRGVIQECR